MNMSIVLAFITYFSLLFLIGLFALKRSLKTADFNLGSRSVNYWVTAISVQASDMSDWLFMAYPALVYSRGLMEGWAAIGLIIGMFLTWNFVAPKLRSETEKYNSRTLSSFFESRFNDHSGLIRIMSALFCLVFFTFYISSGLVGLGLLFEAVLQIPYHVGISIGVIVVSYILFGGFVAMAWVDFFQGIFLLAMLIVVPVLALGHVGGFQAVAQAAHLKNISLSLFPNFSLTTISDICITALGWGLGYFGMPHVLTKFMGIDDVRNMRRAKYIGMTWQILVLTCATIVGLVGIAFYSNGLSNNQLVFVSMVKDLFPPFFAGVVLCAVVAAAINVIGAQILSSASIIAEDFYKKILTKNADRDAHAEQTKILWVSRACVLVICLLAYVSALTTKESIYNLVKYAWSGLGCTFGPLLLVSLHTKTTNRFVALTGIVLGGVTGAFWPDLRTAMIAGYATSVLGMALVNFVLKKKNA